MSLESIPTFGAPESNQPKEFSIDELRAQTELGGKQAAWARFEIDARRLIQERD